MVGDGPWLERLKNFSNRLNLVNIYFRGFQDPKEYYQKARIMFLTSNFEGWALTLTEAMQYGCIPFAYNTYESISDIIIDGNNGFLIKPFDNKLFANKVESFINENDFDKFSLNAVKSMKNFKMGTFILFI